MSTVAPISGDWPEILIEIKTDGRLDLGNVGRFLQRVNTGIRTTRPLGTPVPRVEIVRIGSGSIIIRIAVASLAVASAQLAVELYQYLQTNEAAARVGRDLIQADNATSITINGGSNTFNLGENDVPKLSQTVDRAVAGRTEPRLTRELVMLSGPTTGIAKRFDGEWWVELEQRKGLMLRVSDEREPFAPLKENVRYRFEGQPFIGNEGRLSGYVLHSAMELN